MQKTRLTPFLSIVIPSRANNLSLLEQILGCLAQQSFQDFEVLIVCDRDFTDQERETFQSTLFSFVNFPNKDKKIRLFSHQNADFVPHHQGGASYVRNFGIKHAQGVYLQLFDDDNEFDADYLEKILKFHKQFTKKYQKEVVITPTLMRRNTETIQNQGFSDYNYWLARPCIHFLKTDQEFAEIKMFSGNGIFAKTTIMQQVLYDEDIAWIAEDLDFVYSIRELGFPILVFKALKIRHQERDKTYLEQARIGNSHSAQQKIKNLFLRVKKHGNFFQTLIFLWWSSWGISGWLGIKAFFHGWSEKRKIICGLIKGYCNGWRILIWKNK